MRTTGPTIHGIPGRGMLIATALASAMMWHMTAAAQTGDGIPPSLPSDGR